MLHEHFEGFFSTNFSAFDAVVGAEVTRIKLQFRGGEWW